MIIKYFLLILFFPLALTKKPKLCGVAPTYKVIGGTPIYYPWYVVIALKKRNKNSEKLVLHCGGSLITRKDVLTAAHCLEKGPNGENPVEYLVVHLDVRNACRRTGHGQKQSISRIIRHPKYENSNFGNDIGIIVLKNEVNFVPVCLPKTSSKLPSSAEVIGMGAMHPIFQTSSCKLRRVNLNVISSLKCRNYYSGYNFPKNIICAGNLEEYKDACAGDSGGALQHADPDHSYTIFGIVSFGLGKECRLTPYTIYTDVRKYIPWIKQNVECNLSLF